ncbi:MAG: glycosyl transferase family protein [Pseudomonadota bacterium]
MSGLAPYVHAMGRGPSKGRNLTREEAEHALSLILAGDAAPEATGALFMLMRYRGETAAEIAGFVSALRARLVGWDALPVDLDWPSYAAGRSRGLPWFLLAARLVAQAGHRVLLHGWNSHQSGHAQVRGALDRIGVPLCTSANEAKRAIAADGIAYVPLEALDPRALDLLRLRDVLGLRSPINTALRALNPGRAAASVQGVFHPSYRALQAEATALLGDTRLGVIKGGGGEFERHPGKDVTLWHTKGTSLLPPVAAFSAQRLADAGTDPAALAALWSGQLDHPFAKAIVIGTAAAALQTLDPTRDTAGAEDHARTLWARRPVAATAA